MGRRRLVPLSPDALTVSAAILCPPRRTPGTKYRILGDSALAASVVLLRSMDDITPADDRSLRLPAPARAKRRRSQWYVVGGLYLQGAIVRLIEDWHGPIRWAVSRSAHAQRDEAKRWRIAVAFAEGKPVAYVSPMIGRDPVPEDEARGR